MIAAVNKKDAKGNAPAKLTSFEKKWRESVRSGELSKKYDMLRQRQAMPLKEKIEMSLERIWEWGQAFDGNISVGYSGGKDSEILLYLARKVYPDTPAVFCNTGLEYPEILSQIKHTDNVIRLRPRITFRRVIQDYGWPVISKKVARGLSILRNPTGNNQNIYRLYDTGINRFGEPVNGFKVAKRWRFLIDAPFDISDRCCQIMKKDPMKKYEKSTGRSQMVGMMADDSKAREKVYLQTGCNAFDAKHPKVHALGVLDRAGHFAGLKSFQHPLCQSLRGNLPGQGHGPTLL